jgi:hypothetical protein
VIRVDQTKVAKKAYKSNPEGRCKARMPRRRQEVNNREEWASVVKDAKLLYNHRDKQ